MGHTVLVQLWLMLGTLMEATQLREPSLSFVLGVVREQARLAFSIFICAIFMYMYVLGRMLDRPFCRSGMGLSRRQLSLRYR